MYSITRRDVAFFLAAVGLAFAGPRATAGAEDRAPDPKAFVHIKTREQLAGAKLDDLHLQLVERAVVQALTIGHEADAVEPGANGRAANVRFRIDGDQFDEVIFGSSADAQMTHLQQHLESTLRQQLGALERLFVLTVSQRQKLELPGRGDIRRLFGRIDGAHRRLQVDVDQITFEKSIRDARQRVLSSQEVFDEGSLFAKTFKNSLTPDQIVIDEAIRKIQQAGGLFTTQPQVRVGLQDVELVATTSFSDDDLKHVVRLASLDVLDLSGTKVTDTGLVHIARLTALRNLDLAGTEITDAGIQRLASLQNLQILNLTGTHVTDSGLEHLSSLTRLAHLRLGQTRVTDLGLSLLARLPRLRYLNLDGTVVTDAGLQQLAVAHQLESLFFRKTAVTAGGIENVNKMSKWLQVHR